MSPQYLAARRCLNLLKQSALPSVKKLRLEIQFVQLIRLLLEEDVNESESGTCSRETFDALYRSMFLIRHNSGSHDALNSVMERVGGILVALTSRSTEPTGDAISAQP